MGGEKPKPTGVWSTVRPFIIAGTCAKLAAGVILPLDMIKIRIQLGQGSTANQVLRNMLKNEGVGAFYKGLSAGLIRQAIYTTAYQGTFTTLASKARAAQDGKPLQHYQKVLCLMTSATIGATVSSPADLALTRMQADATLPVAQRRNYSNAFQAIFRISADEGVLSLWKGAGPTVVRAMALHMGIFASSSQTKELLKMSGLRDTTALIAGASSVLGFFAAAFSLPFDYVKHKYRQCSQMLMGSCHTLVR